ncbi:MAG: zinc ribbon domain-containing protein [Actinobacteria bacterium]|nr:zinc ribbon domain-containing protein [Actinomycetota bacterium]
MRRRLFLVVLTVFTFAVLALIWTAPAHAADFSATHMKVSVWPEYDDPRVLVINQADADPALKLPIEVSFNIPKGAEIGMACEIDSSGGHNCKPYQLTDKGDYQTLTYSVETEHKVYLEYYYTAFPAGTPNRSFDFIFHPSFPVQSLDLEVQEPLRSTGFTVEPALPDITADSDGLKYHSKNLGAISIDKPVDVKVSYTKTDDKPSVEKKTTTAAASTSSSGGLGSHRALFVVIGVIVFAGALFFAYTKLRPRRATRPAGRSRSNSSSRRKVKAGGPALAKSQAVTAGSTVTPGSAVAAGSVGSPGSAGSTASKKKRRAPGGGAKYCVDCGEELQQHYRFCAACGTEQPQGR